MSQATTDLIAEAAREILEPLGLRRKGRTRTWIDDRIWWVGVVEFQASQWADRSYLNVGVHWLWDVGGGQVWTAVRGRVDPELRPPEERVDPADDVREFVRAAAEHVLPYRDTFATVADAANHLRQSVAPAKWRDAGIALGLVGDLPEAREMFDRFIGWFETGPDLLRSNAFFGAKYEQARALNASLDDSARFYELVRGAIIAERRRLRLRRIEITPPIAAG